MVPRAPGCPCFVWVPELNPRWDPARSPLLESEAPVLPLSCLLSLSLLPWSLSLLLHLTLPSAWLTCFCYECPCYPC